MAILNNLIVNGAARFLNKTYFDTISANTIDANEGIFKKLVAKDSTLTDVTVVGLMDVTGELHTKSFTNSNIATIDGSFYITPTLGLQGANTTTNTVTVTANSLSFANASGTAFSFESLYLENTTSPVAWSTGSSVIVTGEIQDKTTNEWMPLGTLKGTLSTYSTTSVVINSIKDSANGTAPATLAAIVASGTTSGLKYRNIKVSLVSINRSGLKPLGIFMTATGSNGRTFLDIYGGNNDEANTYGGLSTPVLRIGNLNGLPTVAGVAPTGWGIYTSNGFFSGTIAATQGKIGSGTKIWTIGSDGNNRSYIYSGPTSVSGTTAGTYVGTDGFLNYNSGTQYVKITGGVITAQGANIQGTLTAGAGSMIGPWTVDSNAIYNPSTKSSLSSDTIDGVYLGSNGIALGKGIFKVTNAGVLTATGAQLKSLTIYDENGNKRAGATTNGFIVYDGASANTTTELARFGSTVVVGKNVNGYSRVEIAENGIAFIRRKDNADVELMYIGYIMGTSADGTSTQSYAPYYSLGYRYLNWSTYSATESYSVGDIVKYTDGDYYVCICNNTQDDPSDPGWGYEGWEILYPNTIGLYSFVNGYLSIATGYGAHADGGEVVAQGQYSHAEGARTVATGDFSHAEGSFTTATSDSSHAEGKSTRAIGQTCHAEGYNTIASGYGSHAEGYNTVVSGDYAHAGGYDTKAPYNNQTVIGKYNINVDNALIIGNGTSNSARSNALTVDWDGNVNIASGAKYKINGTNLAASDVGAVADCTLSLYNGAGGNPGVAKFCTVNYTGTDSNNGVLFKTTFMAGHGNGTSYNHLQDAIISVGYNGAVSVDIYRYYAQSVTYASATHYYGDILYTIDTTNKIVTFYTLMGQYSTTKFSPYKRLNASTGGTITQHTGTASMGASGTTTFANVYWLNGTNVGYATSAGSATTCSYPAGFASRTTGATWGNTIGTSFTCWNDPTGGSIDFRQDNPSSGKVSLKVDGRFYYNEGATPVWGLTSANGYWGMTDPDGNTGSNCWIRTTQAGIIPYESGGRGSGHNYLGTDSWYFSQGYIDNVHGVTLDFSGTATIGGVTRINNSLYSDVLYTGSGVVNGNLSVGGNLYQSSDRRLKKHISYLNENSKAIQFIRSLKPAHYVKDDEKHVGFYAQDVRDIDYWGNLTKKNQNNDYLTLNYSEIIAPLVSYCQYLEKRIESLEREVRS